MRKYENLTEAALSACMKHAVAAKDYDTISQLNIEALHRSAQPIRDRAAQAFNDGACGDDFNTDDLRARGDARRLAAVKAMLTEKFTSNDIIGGRSLGGRRWADGTTRDSVGNITHPWQPDSNHALYLETHCAGCGAGRGLCKAGCPRVEAASNRCADDDENGYDARNGKAPKYVSQYDYVGQIMFDVEDAIMEISEDNLLVELPDTDRAFVEFVAPAEKNDPSDPLGHQECLRITPHTFRPTITEAHMPCETPPLATRHLAARALSRALTEYLRLVRGDMPPTPNWQTRTREPYANRLFTLWRKRPEIIESTDPAQPGFIGRARFAAVWAHKKFAPTMVKCPVADVSGLLMFERATPDLPTFDEVAPVDWSKLQDPKCWVGMYGTPGLTGNAYFDAKKAEFNAERRAANNKRSYDSITPEQWHRGIVETDQAFAIDAAMSTPIDFSLQRSPPEAMLMPDSNIPRRAKK